MIDKIYSNKDYLVNICTVPNGNSTAITQTRDFDAWCGICGTYSTNEFDELIKSIMQNFLNNILKK